MTLTLRKRTRGESSQVPGAVPVVRYGAPSCRGVCLTTDRGWASSPKQERTAGGRDGRDCHGGRRGRRTMILRSLSSSRALNIQSGRSRQVPPATARDCPTSPAPAVGQQQVNLKRSMLESGLKSRRLRTRRSEY